MKALKKFTEKLLLQFIGVKKALPLQIDITNACNLKCIHCYHPHHKNDGAIGLEDWKGILQQYKALILKIGYSPSIVICGGEPLVSSLLFPILDYVKAILPKSSISILTNGTMITQDMVTKLKSYSSLRFQVSLDGPTSDQHDHIRGKGNFEKAIRGIRLLKANQFDVKVLAVLSKKTSFWLEDFFKLAVDEKFDALNFVRFVPEGFGKKLVEASSDEPLIGVALKEAYQKILHLILKYQVRSRTQLPLFDLLIPGLGRSGQYGESIVIDYQGYVVASSRSKLRLGDARSDGLEKIFLHHPIYVGLRKGNIEGCGECTHFKVCGGDRNAAYAATGNFLGIDPGCWKEEFKNINQMRAL